MIEEALDHAERIVTESGAGAVTIAEIARQMGIRPPSLYKYFASLHAVYDGLFARGNTRLTEYVDAATGASRSRSRRGCSRSPAR